MGSRRSSIGTYKVEEAENILEPADAVRHELSWLLLEGETENEILANPYIFKDDVETLL